MTKPTLEPKGHTVTILMSTDLVPRPTTAVQSETADFTPQAWDDVSTTITMAYYADGSKVHEKAQLVNYSDVFAETSKKVGVLAQETIESLARRAACQGTVVFRGTNTTRATLDQGTPGDRMRQALFTKVQQFTQHWQTNKFVDGTVSCIMSPWQFGDLMTEASGVILLAQAYTERGRELMANYELGQLYGVRLIVDAKSKVCWGAAAANATTISTTLNDSAANAGDTSVTLTSSASITAGMWLHIGTAETGNESDTTLITEPVYVTAVDSPSANDVTFIGSGPLGGLKYTHANGVAVTNKDSAHLAVFGGPNSLAKAYHAELGEYGELVPPFETGNAKQWTTMSFKWSGGYGRINEGWLIRAETSASEI